MDAFHESARSHAAWLADALGSRLRSVVLHGSVARGEAVAGVSDLNLLVLVDRVDASLLRALAPEARGWLEKEGSLPLVLSWEEWAAASDAFAVETADMADAHEVLHGDDPFDGAVVRPRDLRLQAERELRGKLIHLREATLASADRPEELGRLVITALPSVATYLRTALRLAGRAVPAATPATLREGGGLVGADPDPLTRLWAMREERSAPAMEADDPLLRSVHEALERTVQYVDAFTGDEA